MFCGNKKTEMALLIFTRVREISKSDYQLRDACLSVRTEQLSFSLDVFFMKSGI